MLYQVSEHNNYRIIDCCLSCSHRFSFDGHQMKCNLTKVFENGAFVGKDKDKGDYPARYNVDDNAICDEYKR